MSSTLAFPFPDIDAPNPHNHRTSASPPSAAAANTTTTSAASPVFQGDAALSPNTANHFETPSSALTSYSDLELDQDPFFGAMLGNDEEQAAWLSPSHLGGYDTASSLYPLTPEQAAPVQLPSPHGEHRAAAALSLRQVHLTPSISPQELQRPFTTGPEPSLSNQPSQLTPSQSSSAHTSAHSSEDGLAPAAMTVHAARSPRVTVSVWDQDHDEAVTRTAERSLEIYHDEADESPRGGIESAGDLISSEAQKRDSAGRWHQNLHTGLAGLGPAERLSDEIPSANELARRRRSDERNVEVGRWLSDNFDEPSVPHAKTGSETFELQVAGSDDGIPPGEIPLGDTTENRNIPGQTYYAVDGGTGPMNDQDRVILARDRNWGDAPMFPHIMRDQRPGVNQPATSQAAIEHWQRLQLDNRSIISRQATWGTRRRSIQSTADLEGVLSGNILKKLSISKNQESGGLFKDLRGFVRRSSIGNMRKRRNSGASNASDDGNGNGSSPSDGVADRRDGGAASGSPHLAPPDRTSSWGRKATPSITALVSAGSSAASIGHTHARKSSVGAVSMVSPKGFMQSLKVDKPLQRPRSRSDVPKPTAAHQRTESHPNILGMLKANGGLPVAALTKSPVPIATKQEPADDDDDDDDDDDEGHDDGGIGHAGKANLIDTVTPNNAGFQEYVRLVNPNMDPRHNYLVERLAHHQIVRYKSLLNHRVKHLGLGANCPCGPLCMAMGGQANVLDSKGEAKGLDPVATRLMAEDDEDDEGAGSGDGAISPDSFPQDVPMPPTRRLPAEFECQLCYTRKKFTKPSDWTKHVHEDVMPFTCTWDGCRDAKSFKRKADWVRHENEGHRHLEWWTCNVDECRHTCYRRDNFLQHLVREHKFLEPRVKTKAAIKKSGGADPTWSKVEECHANSKQQPQDEPCRFCGRSLPTWKKLMVHLAKHMEQLSLPVLRLVEAKAREMDADTIISPVQDPPARNQTAFPLPLNSNSFQPGQVQEHQLGMVGGDFGTVPAGSMGIHYNGNGGTRMAAYGAYPGQLAPSHQQAQRRQQFNGRGGGRGGFYSGGGDGVTAHGMQQQRQQTMASMGQDGFGQVDMTNAMGPYSQGYEPRPVMYAAAAGGDQHRHYQNHRHQHQQQPEEIHQQQSDNGALEAFPRLLDDGSDLGLVGGSVMAGSTMGTGGVSYANGALAMPGMAVGTASSFDGTSINTNGQAGSVSPYSPPQQQERVDWEGRGGYGFSGDGYGGFYSGE
ncbi:ZnF C2H2 [Geosmithia morbida]|uniref:ZnF C2H2 n=1 Tax=Geosmithia morbida TaxID=1094350 RepID=A0A9P5D5L8_9HYPO|nr:ZnF C2H2 [Geosmithia morbida]KAF4123920.1 ZnF C2H2 [Geosmithia morbida]